MDRCGDKDCPGGHEDIRTGHCRPRLLVDGSPAVEVAMVIQLPTSARRCPVCGFAAYFAFCSRCQRVTR